MQNISSAENTGERLLSKYADAVVEDLKQWSCSCPVPGTEGIAIPGAALRLDFEFPDHCGYLETALASLKKLICEKGISCSGNAGFVIRIFYASGFVREEFLLDINSDRIELSASDTEGIRRGIYLLEDKFKAASGAAVEAGAWRRKPYIDHRISRCFFGPTNRYPYYIDELMNDEDYYPEPYLDKLAHEGVNGLWLTMYFKDLPSSFFHSRGKDAEKRFEKLRRTVAKCARYGIKIYVFFCEPKMFGPTRLNYLLSESELHPEMTGHTLREASEKLSSKNEFRHFCTSSPEGLEYLKESVETLFRNVPDLGGMINIVYGEDQGGCIDDYIDTGYPVACPRCAGRIPGEIYRDCAAVMCQAMKKYAPDAEYIGWFYAPRQRDDSEYSERLAALSKFWDENSVMMLNMESGVEVEQLGKGRNLFDYSLACTKPSKLFLECVSNARKSGAKIQVGCSHEDASVPFIPVPLNLYRKYRVLHDLGVCTVMQCWYFGNYPGVMNRAAGRLSMEPFPADEDEFLNELAAPDWGVFSPTVVQAWKYFSEGYSKFPANIGFEWYGPLHNSIVWPLHLMPVDKPIAPSWIMKSFPAESGDRIGECLNYQHTLDEALTLCREMSETWAKGVELLAALRSEFAGNQAQLRDIGLAEAVGLQMKSTVNILTFYRLREEMFHSGKNHLPCLESIVKDEIANTSKMLQLCLDDPRLGYHSEAEGHLFYPEKLSARIGTLETLLKEEFASFSPDDPRIAQWVGRDTCGKVVHAVRRGYQRKIETLPGSGIKFALEYDDDKLILIIFSEECRNLIAEIEPCRLWTPVRVDFLADGTFRPYSWVFRKEPALEAVKENGCTYIEFPWELFDGYRREGAPMRFNLRSDKESFVPGEPWPDRLLMRDYNPACAAWLICGE